MSRPLCRPWLSAALLGLSACTSTFIPADAVPLTAEEVEYQRRLQDAPNGPLDARGRSELLVRLDSNLRYWNRAAIEEIGSPNQLRAENFTEVLQREVYLNFDVVLDALASGEPHQQEIAAAALGFSKLREPADADQQRLFVEKWPRLYPRAIEPLQRGMERGDSELAKNCLLALWLLADPATPIQPILPFVRSPDADTRSMAALALSSIITPETGEAAISTLLNALYDDDAKVRTHAATAVARARHKDAAGRLVQMLEDPQFLVQANAARALGELGDAKNSGYLVGRLDSLMRERPSGRSRERQPIDDRRDVVLHEVLGSLRKLSGEDFGTDAAKWREWWDDARASFP